MFWFLLLCFIGNGETKKEPYKNYIVISVTPTNEEQLLFLKELHSNPDIDFWLSSNAVGMASHIMIPPFHREILEKSLAAKGIRYSVLVKDVQKIVDKERKGMKDVGNKPMKIQKSKQDFFDDFRSLTKIHQFMDQLKVSYSSKVCIQKFARTHENRLLVLMKIGTRSTILNRANVVKPVIWIDALIHAREWISSPAALYIANQLLVNYEHDEDVKTLVDTYDWYFVPVVNPDGYSYTRNGNRLWRKNRRPIPGTNKTGVDLNRNFRYMWNYTDDPSQRNVSSIVYQGPQAFSEKETATISKILKSLRCSLKIFLTFHSYGQMWLTPFSYTLRPPFDYMQMKQLATIGNEGMKTYNGTTFAIKRASRSYLHSGTSLDWVYGELGVKYSYGVEIGNEAYEFLTPKEHIRDIGEEMWRAVKAMSLHVAITENLTSVMQL